MKKRVLSIFTTIAMLCSFLGIIPTVEVSAVSNADIRTKILSILYNNAGGKMTCDFDGYVNTKGRHEGIDFAIGRDKPVYSLINGKVTAVKNSNSSSTLSTLTIYDSKNDKTVIYLHTANICVSVGSYISRGTKVATESDRGSGGAVHTHVEVRNGNRTAAAKSVNDYTLENSNPYPYWEKVLFEESVPPSPKPKVSTNQENYVPNSTVNISWTKSDGATSYWLAIWYGGEQIFSESVGNTTTFSKKFSGVGEYGIFVEAYNDYGGITSECKNFYVENIANLGNEFCGLILHKKSWKPIMVKEDGYNMVLGTENSKNMRREIWRFYRNSDGSYRIQSFYNDYSLDVIDSKDENGAKTCVWKNHDGANQKWYIILTDYGYMFRPACSNNKVLDLPHENTEDGTPIEIYEKHGETNQKFEIYKFKEPGKTTLSAKAGTSTKETKFIWSKSSDTDKYTIKIYKDKIWEGTPITHETTGTEWSTVLPEGKYQVYIDSSNNYSYTMSNVVTIEVKKGEAVTTATTKITTKPSTTTKSTVTTTKSKITTTKPTGTTTKLNITTTKSTGTTTKLKNTTTKPTGTTTKSTTTTIQITVTTTKTKDTTTKSTVITQTTSTTVTPIKTNVDLNGDGKINTADIVLFQNIALKKYNDIAYIVDLNGDGVMNVFDMIILKRAVLAKS